MKLMKILEKENSKTMCTLVLDWVGTNPARFGQLVTLLLKGKPVIMQRASWPLSLCVEAHPILAQPHLKVLVHNLRRPNLHDAVRRSTMRLLQYVAIPKSLQGEVTNRCFTYLTDQRETIGVKVFSMTVLSVLSKQLPDLGRELRMILEDQLPYASPGYASRARKTLTQLSRLSKTNDRKR